jgi:hypothetical protein
MNGIATPEVLARWFGPLTDEGAAAIAFDTLNDQIRRRFGVPLYRSPGLTGALVWKRNYGEGWQPLPMEFQTLIRNTTGQGRFEVTACVDPLPALYCLDLRLAYAAGAASVQSGQEWRYEERTAGGWIDGGMEGKWPDEVRGFRGWQPARYQVIFHPPEGWSHVGILPCRCSKLEGWHWPKEGNGTAWADAAEVRLALAHGWHVEVLARLTCAPQAKSYPYPLRTWVTNLLRLRDDLAGPPSFSSNPADWGGELYRTAIRAMILQAIGIFAARPRTELRTVASRDELPSHELAEETYHEREDGTVEFEDYAASPQMMSLLHPEFAAAVWADTRVRLLHQNSRPGENWSSGALHLPREKVVGFGLDALYTTLDPNWPDDGRPGRYRVKWERSGPLPSPRDRRELEGYAP